MGDHMDNDIKFYNKDESLNYWGEGIDIINQDINEILESVKTKFNRPFLIQKLNSSDIEQNFISRFQHLTMIQIKGSVKYIFPLVDQKLIFDLNIKKKIANTLDRNNIIEKKEVVLNAGETLCIPFGAIYYQVKETDSSEFYELSEEDICYREMVTFCGRTILGLVDFDSNCFEEFDPKMIEAHNLTGHQARFADQAKLFESIVKLGKTRRAKKHHIK